MGWYFILLPNNQGNFQLLIGESRHFSLTTALPDLVANMKVEGSIDNELFFANFLSSTAVDEQMAKIQENINKLEVATLWSIVSVFYKKPPKKKIAGKKSVNFLT
ncbi:MAG TPA: hypothetical protein PLC01_03095 [Methylotenera sp.]|nr:hypothetical protein [Methylotenera sp.]